MSSEANGGLLWEAVKGLVAGPRGPWPCPAAFTCEYAQVVVGVGIRKMGPWQFNGRLSFRT